jgi:hypothetical protein
MSSEILGVALFKRKTGERAKEENRIHKLSTMAKLPDFEVDNHNIIQ